MTIDYIPGTTSNLVGDPAEGGAFSSGNKGEIAGANTAAANAATSATAAAASAATASQSASDLSAAETNAATSATAAATSATAAAADRSATQGFLGTITSIYDQFDDRYLGSKTSEPTIDNDGNALLVGAMYFNSTSNLMKVYNGSAWQLSAVDSTTILLKAQNLADLPSVSTARTNLGLGTMALATATDYATLAGATFTGDVTAPEFIGVLQGETVFKAKAGEALAKGDAVYVSGVSGNTPVVSKADANGANTYPAFGLAAATTANNGTLDVITAGQLKNFDTSGFSLGDTLYLSTTPGVLTATPPAGEDSVIQNIGKVEREHASVGSILVVGAGRTAATPNLNQNNVFVGNASNKAVTQNIGTALSGATVPTLTVTTSNSTTVDTTNLKATNLKAKDGTAAGSIADSTGVVTLASSVLTTTDINGGTADNVVIGGSTAAAGTFTTGTIATADINGGAIDGTVIGGSTAAAGSFTTVTADSVYLGGTVAANLLDDYEEGTWTPEYKGATTNPVYTQDGLTAGRYTKTGNVVHAIGRIRIDALTNAGSGQLAITLPFSVLSDGTIDKQFGVLTVGEAKAFNANFFPHAGWASRATSLAYIVRRTSPHGQTQALNSNDALATADNSNDFVFSITYLTD